MRSARSASRRLIPGTPNISVGMEQFNDTPIVNGTAYPTTTLDPKAYRFRILNAANDRFWNLSWYVADPSTGTDSEVALNPCRAGGRADRPQHLPDSRHQPEPAGSDWIQIGTEGGFLPAPAVVPGPADHVDHRPDPLRRRQRGQALAAAGTRRAADVIVDFSQFAGQTLILYNDAPAAFPARVASYDYYTGGPDLTPAARRASCPATAPTPAPSCRSRSPTPTPAPPLQPDGAEHAFKHHADGSGVFESGQHPIIVGQAAYNSAYGTTFAASGWCTNPAEPHHQVRRVRADQRAGPRPVQVRHPAGPDHQLKIPLEPKAHPRRDELGLLRRVRPDDGQPRPRGGAGDAGRAEHPALPVRRTRRRRSSTARTCRWATVNVTPISDGERRDPDLEDHAQRRGHAPDPLPPLRRAGAQPGHLGQHHHPAGPERAGLEGHRPGEPAGGHDRRPAADHSDAALRDPEQHPAAQPDDAARLDRSGSTTSTRTATPPRRSSTSSSTSAGSTSTTATSSATRRWT